MSEGKENKDSGDLKQIQRILQSQWKGRFKKSEEKTRAISEPPTANVQSEQKKVILRGSLLDKTTKSSTAFNKFYELDEAAVAKLKKTNGLDIFCE